MQLDPANPDWDSLPKTGPAQEGESESLFALARLLENREGTWRFNLRTEPQPDLGVDGTIEIGHFNHRTGYTSWSNLRAYFQLKHTRSPDILSTGKLSYALDVNNLNYLSRSQLPALYIVWDMVGQGFFAAWANEAVAALERHNPNWRHRKKVKIHLRPCSDVQIRHELVAEIQVHSAQLQFVHDGPGFIRDFTRRRHLSLLESQTPFLGRESVIASLCEALQTKKVVCIVGPRGAGKTQVVAHWLNDEDRSRAIEKCFESPVGLVLIRPQERLGPKRLLRSLLFALGLPKLDGIADQSWDGIDREDEYGSFLLGTVIPAKLRGIAPLIVVEDSHLAETEELARILAQPIFQTGAILVLSRRDPNENQFFQEANPSIIRISGLDSASATKLLEELLHQPALVRTALDQLVGIPEILLPGVLLSGGSNFLRRRDQSEATGTDLATDLLSAAIDGLGNHIVPYLKDASESESERSLLTLLGLSILPTLWVNEEDLRQAGVFSPPIAILQQNSWVRFVNGSFRLEPEICEKLRGEVLALLTAGNAQGEQLREVLDRMLMVWERRDEELDDYPRALEEAVSWLDREGFSETIIFHRLLEALVPHTIDDVIPLRGAFSATDVRSRNATIREQFVQLTVALRNECPEDELLDLILSSIAAVQPPHELSGQQLKVLDTAASVYGRKFGRSRDILAARVQLAQCLPPQGIWQTKTASFLKWSISWLLNAAELARKISEAAAARRLVADASTLIIHLPIAITTQAQLDRLSLFIRLEYLEARLAPSEARKLKHLSEALRYGREALFLSTGAPYQVRLYLRAARSIALELRSDTDRLECFETMISSLNSLWGSTIRDWPLQARAQVAALLRDIASRISDDDLQLVNAKQAVQILASGRSDVISLAKMGDNRPLLVLARTNALLAVCYGRAALVAEQARAHNVAKELCAIALQYGQSAEIWSLSLELQDQEPDESRQDDDAIEPFPLPQAEIGVELKKAIRGYWTWVSTSTNPGVEEGRVALWCVQRQFRRDGKLEQWIIRDFDNYDDWLHLHTEDKIQFATERYYRRRNQLAAIETRFGRFPELSLAYLAHELNYRRLLAAFRHEDLDTAPLFSILRQAQDEWPEEVKVMIAESKLQRYLWRHSEAIIGFRRAIELSTDGRARNHCMFLLAEALLSAALISKRQNTSQGMLREAQQVLVDLSKTRSLQQTIPILANRIALELSVPINWDNARAQYEKTIRPLRDLLPTGGEGSRKELLLKARASDESDINLPSRPPSIAAIRGWGSLFLRKAERASGPDVILDCQLAYQAFAFCQLLEEGWFGSESPTTSFQRSRAIFVAAQNASSADPFPAELYGKRSLLALADARAQSALDSSLGKFRTRAQGHLQEVLKLRAKLERPNR